MFASIVAFFGFHQTSDLALATPRVPRNRAERRAK